ncbi:MAG: HAMP domain-containing protein [Solirubrobacterales bacterium]|nr:HAMP domain-containing protein [Solirubrobacterales bacterium]
MSRLPIRLRVTLVFATAMAVLLGALCLFVYLRFQAQLTEAVDQGLRTRADEVASLARESGSALKRSSQDALAESEESFAQLLLPSGEVLDSTEQLGSQAALSAEEARAASSEPVLIERSELPAIEGSSRILAGPIELGGRPRVLVVGSSLDDRDEALGSLAVLLGIGAPVALLLASLAGFAAASAALRPVEAMRRRAEAVSAEDPGERLPLPAARDELRRLGTTLNEMLDRLAAGLERERAFVDDASHELRTPLALHKTELELALRYGESPEELRRSISSAIEEADRLAALAEDMLVVARAEGREIPLRLESIDARALLSDVRERFASRADTEGREIAIAAGEPVAVLVDRLRLEQAISNLLDNALRHGEGKVTLAAERRDDAVELHVRDEGAGLPPDFIAHAFERFSRGDAARGRGGTGLGLAIVDAIARAHSGSTGVRNLDSGGADLWVEVPAGESG